MQKELLKKVENNAKISKKIFKKLKNTESISFVFF